MANSASSGTGPVLGPLRSLGSMCEPLGKGLLFHQARGVAYARLYSTLHVGGETNRAEHRDKISSTAARVVRMVVTINFVS